MSETAITIIEPDKDAAIVGVNEYPTEDHPMTYMANILPFPLLKRSGFIAKQARYIATVREHKQRRELERLVEVQRDAMRRRCVPDDLIEREIAGFRVSLSVELALLNRRDRGAA
jgi:methylmalonyl-CoA mutase N-terminal domain/subunit